MNITDDIKYIGVNDHKIDLFEEQYAVPNGMSYNSYVILDEKIAVLDTVDANFSEEWLQNLDRILNGRTPDYLIVQHMEPDHSANIAIFMDTYPKAKIVASGQAFAMMKNYYGKDYDDRQIIVGEGNVLDLGTHKLHFYTAPMVHWPEVIVTYDSTDKVLFSADGFGSFGALDREEAWVREARRYYIGIVGKYGGQVQKLLKKAEGLDIQLICPLHGPVLKEKVNDYLKLYHIWSGYQPEEEGIVIAYASVYGNTKKAVLRLAERLVTDGCAVVVYDLARCDMSVVVADAFRYSKLVLASTTYNGGVFPCMREFIQHLTDRNFSNRIVAFVENGSWAPQAGKIMREMLAKGNNLTYLDHSVKIMSALNEESFRQLEELKQELIKKI